MNDTKWEELRKLELASGRPILAPPAPGNSLPVATDTNDASRWHRVQR